MAYFWEQRKLGELGTITTGSTPSTSIPDYYSDDGIVWVTPTDICENITFESARKLSDLGQQVGRVVPKNTILVTCIASIGKNTMLGNTGSFNQQINGLTPNENECDPYFLLTESALWSAKMKSSAAAGTMQIVNRTEFSELKTWLPSLIEQQAISNFFRQLDNLITLHQREYEGLQIIEKTMLEKMFSKNGSEIPEIRFDGFTYDWEQRKLGELTLESSEYATLSSKLPLLTSSRSGLMYQNEYRGNLTTESEKTIFSVVPFGTCTYRHMSDDDIFHLNINTLEKGLVSREYPVFMASEDNVLEFIVQYINSSSKFRAFCAEQKKGGTRTRLYYKTLCEFSFMVTKSKEQQRIAEFFTDLDHLITLHQRQLEKLQNIKKSMLKKMFVQKKEYPKQREEESMIFTKEAEFEEALIRVLTEKGWEKEVIKYPMEADLIKNWADILFDNNRSIDKLNNYPLTDGEMQQLIEKITEYRTPLKLNSSFINAKSISIKRDNPDDKDHFGKEVSLKLYDRREIAAGQSRYQIVQQPIFAKKTKTLNDRRGDLMLLINGMPLIHIELKRSGIPVSQAYNQIEKYSHEGVFTGLFSLVQVFVAMNPDETVYFANPGPDGKFNMDYYFHWADFNNEPINNWKDIASTLLSIPMAHQLIGFYTVADNADGVLKVMRSYQYYAANAISDVVSKNKNKWDLGKQRGGYVWHTTGSGKTMTSFKSAQLIASSNDADKVVFLTDRIELGTQSLKEYRSFAGDNDTVQETENTDKLISKLKSPDSDNTLIVTSIQKMSNIQNEECGLNNYDIECINKKRLVFIVDEAHRSTFGDMLQTIKKTFPNAMFFGFTGTPVFEENAKKNNAQTDVFGNELHRYSIADGIRDKNVLGFDPYKVMTFRDKDIRKVVALYKAKASTEEEAISDEKKAKKFYEYMDSSKIKMAGYTGNDGQWVNGIEDYLPNSQYLSEEHQKKVVEDIKDNWMTLSHNGKFHAIFATSSISEAIEYYELIRSEMPELKVTCLFDPNIDNNGGVAFKEDGLVKILTDYKKLYDLEFTIASHAKFKKDVALRLAHKKPYNLIDRTPEKQLDMLIVVDQMLTGFDSKWVNTLYMDKILEYENVIQAFSRTNRLFGPDKPFGMIRYYRKPHTMEQNVLRAVKMYSGDRPIGLFVEKLQYNLKKMNEVFADITDLFKNAGIADFEKLPEDPSVKAKFASLFREFNEYLEAAKVQGMQWDKRDYKFIDETGGSYEITTDFDENAFLIMAQRYKEMSEGDGGDGGDQGELPYDLVGYLTEIDTGVIDAEYMNSRFNKYLKLLKQDGVPGELLEQAKAELHKTFAVLSQEEQKYANIFLHDIERGDVIPNGEKTLRDYITEYQYQAKNDQVHRLAVALGLNEEKLREMMGLSLNEFNINEFGRLDELKKSVDRQKAKEYFEAKDGTKLIPPKVNMKIDRLLRDFIRSGGFDI